MFTFKLPGKYFLQFFPLVRYLQLSPVHQLEEDLGLPPVVSNLSLDEEFVVGGQNLQDKQELMCIRGRLKKYQL